MEEEKENKHRDWLKSHEGLHYQIASSEKDINKKWLENYKDEKYNSKINLIEIGGDEIIIEFDENTNYLCEDKNKQSTQEQREEAINKTIENLRKDNIGYDLFDHKGKCKHIHIYLNKNATKEQKELIIKYFVPKEFFDFVDLSLCGVHLIAVPYCKHWRHKTIKELVENRGGLIIDIDDDKYKKLINKEDREFIVQKSSNSISEIVSKIRLSDLALKYGAKKGKGTKNYHCCFHNDKHPSLSIDDKKGVFKCFASSCGKEGGIVDFISEAEHISKEEAKEKLKDMMGYTKEDKINYPIVESIIKDDYLIKIFRKFGRYYIQIYKGNKLIVEREYKRGVNPLDKPLVKSDISKELFELEVFSKREEARKYLTKVFAELKQSFTDSIKVDNKKIKILKESKGESSDYITAFKRNEQGMVIEVDYKTIALTFLKRQPFFYDKHKLWWFWNFEKYKWEIVDDVDVMIGIDRGLNWSATTDSGIKNRILESLKRVGRINTPKEPKRVWIQFFDKIYDIENNELIDASPLYFITNPIPWKMGESEDTPTIDRIFEEWVGKEYVQTLKEIVAYCLLTYMPIHRIFGLIGVGLNGKGSFLRLIEKFVGKENATATSIERLNKGNFESAKLYKKLVAVIGEIDKEIFKRTSIIKSLSGDDLIPIEFKGKDPFETHNYAKPIIAANTLPETTDKTKGFYRRWTIVDFPNQFSEKKDILSEIPEQEFNNFCKQVPRILKELIAKGEFTNDGTIENREERYKERSSPINRFIKENCEKGNDYKVEFSKLCNEICLFLEENNYPKMSENLIARTLTILGFDSKMFVKKNELGYPTSQRYRMGLKLKGDENE